MSDVIELRGLRVSAIVGVLAEERHRAQPLEFDLDVERSFDGAAMDDDIAETTDYAAVVATTVAVARSGGFLLLETLAYRVALDVLALDGAIDAVVVAVRKLHPPVPEDLASAGVRCRVER